MFRTPIARMTTRMIGGGDGLFIGSATKDGIKHFKPNTVYELQWCPLSEQIVLKEVGESVVSTGSVWDSPIRVSWGLEFQNVVMYAQQNLYWTRQEYERIKGGECDI